jgi:hypothetical protein
MLGGLAGYASGQDHWRQALYDPARAMPSRGLSNFENSDQNQSSISGSQP